MHRGWIFCSLRVAAQIPDLRPALGATGCEGRRESSEPATRASTGCLLSHVYGGLGGPAGPRFKKKLCHQQSRRQINMKERRHAWILHKRGHSLAFMRHCHRVVRKTYEFLLNRSIWKETGSGSLGASPAQVFQIPGRGFLRGKVR